MNCHLHPTLMFSSPFPFLFLFLYRQAVCRPAGMVVGRRMYAREGRSLVVVVSVDHNTVSPAQYLHNSRSCFQNNPFANVQSQTSACVISLKKQRGEATTYRIPLPGLVLERPRHDTDLDIHPLLGFQREIQTRHRDFLGKKTRVAGL